jgi:hypothetical protein
VASDDSTPDDNDDSVAELLPEDPPKTEADLLPDDPLENLETEDLAPDPPTIPDTSANDADPELKKRFWSLVMIFNVALFGMSLGLMVVGFRGQWKVGGAIFAVGAFAFLRGWRGYQQVNAKVESSADESDSVAEKPADADGSTDTAKSADTDDSGDTPTDTNSSADTDDSTGTTADDDSDDHSPVQKD